MPENWWDYDFGDTGGDTSGGGTDWFGGGGDTSWWSGWGTGETLGGQPGWSGFGVPSAGWDMTMTAQAPQQTAPVSTDITPADAAPTDLPMPEQLQPEMTAPEIAAPEGTAAAATPPEPTAAPQAAAPAAGPEDLSDDWWRQQQASQATTLPAEQSQPPVPPTPPPRIPQLARPPEYYHALEPQGLNLGIDSAGPPASLFDTQYPYMSAGGPSAPEGETTPIQFTDPVSGQPMPGPGTPAAPSGSPEFAPTPHAEGGLSPFRDPNAPPGFYREWSWNEAAQDPMGFMRSAFFRGAEPPSEEAVTEQLAAGGGPMAAGTLGPFAIGVGGRALRPANELLRAARALYPDLLAPVESAPDVGVARGWNLGRGNLGYTLTPGEHPLGAGLFPTAREFPGGYSLIGQGQNLKSELASLAHEAGGHLKSFYETGDVLPKLPLQEAQARVGDYLASKDITPAMVRYYSANPLTGGYRHAAMEGEFARAIRERWPQGLPDNPSVDQLIEALEMMKAGEWPGPGATPLPERFRVAPPAPTARRNVVPANPRRSPK